MIWPASGATLNRDHKVHPSGAPGRLRPAVSGFPWRAVAAGGLGGLGLCAAFPPLAWWPLAIPAVTLITLACAGRGWRGGLLVGLAAGLAQFVPLIYWLHVVTPLAWLVLAIAESLYLAALGAGLAAVVGRLPGWQLWTACLWVGEELIRSRWPLDGFGWGRLAFSQANTPFTGYAAIAGAPLVTFAVALCAALLASAALRVARAIRTGRPRPGRGLAAAAAFALAALVVPVGSSLIPRPVGGEPVQVAVVQGNVPQPGTHFLGRAEQVLDRHLAETAK